MYDNDENKDNFDERPADGFAAPDYADGPSSPFGAAPALDQGAAAPPVPPYVPPAGMYGGIPQGPPPPANPYSPGPPEAQPGAAAYYGAPQGFSAQTWPAAGTARGTGHGPGNPGGPDNIGGAAATSGGTAANTAGVLGIGRKNLLILIIIIVVACAASGVGGGVLGARLSDGTTIVGSGGSDVVINPSSDINTTEAVAKKVLASVVGITSTGTVQSNDFFWGPQSQEISGVGTGMIIDKEGYILTNSHVVMDGAVESIKVLLNTGDEVEGKVIWNDASLDLAIVKINAKELSPVELGDSDDVQIGSYVAAIGNPLGLEFNGSITQGVVSGLDRTITVSDTTGSKTVRMEGLIQVDAAINSGNSGGPLLNSKGQVIGVNTAKASAEGMGFAIPINIAIPIIEKVIENGNFERVYMGVSAADVSVIKENYPSVELKADKGACITQVNPGSPAEQAGLEVKDVITAADGKAINGSSDLIKQLLGYESGDKVEIAYSRDGKDYTTTVTLVSQDEIQQIQQERDPFSSAPQEEAPQSSPFG
ncbi:MAG: S1C family serine protease [Clostridiales Family XIII bacterium]|jgi:S1-C subfamily serine protease|nr:S1C family serine protease [Clostridiales Family XIII bacterium]